MSGVEAALHGVSRSRSGASIVDRPGHRLVTTSNTSCVPRVVVSLFGPVRVDVDGHAVELGGPRERTVFAALALSPEHTVSTDLLAVWLWDEHPPDTSRKSIQNAVMLLRRVLAPSGLRIERVGDGYALRADEPWARDDGAAGEPLAGVAETVAVLGARGQLAEERVAELERELERLIAVDASDAVGRLESLVAQYPLRENLWSLLMRALYRAGRQAEALASYQRARSALRDRAGVEPGDRLRALEARILRQDPALLVDDEGARARELLEDGLDAQWFWGDASMEATLEKALAELGHPPGDRRLAGRIAARLALLRGIRADPRAKAMAARAVSLTNGSNATEHTLALFAQACAWEGPDDLEARIENGTALLAHGQQSGDRVATAYGHLYRGWAALEHGDFAAAEHERAAALASARGCDHAHLLAQMADTKFLGALFHGDLGNAAALVDEIELTWNRSAEPGFAAVTVLAARIFLGELTDGLDALQPSVQAMAEAFPGDAGWPITIALGHALAGRHDDARRVLATITSSELRSMPRTTTWIANVSGLAFAASTCRDLRAAEIAVELLKPFEGQHVVVGALAYRGAVAHWLGVCTATLGEHRDAIQLLDHALDDHRRAQTPPWIAQSTRALAELDARRR